MNVLVLGATGFIGSHIALHLQALGYRVTGLGRSTGRAAARHPRIEWLRADLSALGRPEDWSNLLAGCDVVVNCAGALQDGPGDDLTLVQDVAQRAMQAAAVAAGVRLIVQISAKTDGSAADTQFLATKRQADAALASCGVPYVLLRPALVVGRNAFGATALIRALAAFPFVTPLAEADKPVQLVTIDDVARATAAAIDGRLAPGTDLALAAPRILPLKDVVALTRAWLGLPAQRTLAVPAMLATPVAAIADLLGRLGWRSPLRSTAMSVMRQGVLAADAEAAFETEDPATWFGRHPAGVQDLWTARLYLLKPLVFATLALFWIVSGLVPLLDVGAAAARFGNLLPAPLAQALTLATCLLDVALGCLLLYRPAARGALIGMFAVSAAYLLGSLVFEPALWADPLGPMVKVFPALALTLVALAILEER